MIQAEYASGCLSGIPTALKLVADHKPRDRFNIDYPICRNLNWMDEKREAGSFGKSDIRHNLHFMLQHRINECQIVSL
jgi:hypothetical protein